jgi:hypothetical protein
MRKAGTIAPACKNFSTGKYARLRKVFMIIKETLEALLLIII